MPINEAVNFGAIVVGWSYFQLFDFRFSTISIQIKDEKMVGWVDERVWGLDYLQLVEREQNEREKMCIYIEKMWDDWVAIGLEVQNCGNEIGWKMMIFNRCERMEAIKRPLQIDQRQIALLSTFCLADKKHSLLWATIFQKISNISANLSFSFPSPNFLLNFESIYFCCVCTRKENNWNMLLNEIG